MREQMLEIKLHFGESAISQRVRKYGLKSQTFRKELDRRELKGNWLVKCREKEENGDEWERTKKKRRGGEGRGITWEKEERERRGSLRRKKERSRGI